MRRIVRITAGVILILLGIPGLVLPILQGWLFLALGALLLSVDIPFFDRMVNWIGDRVPGIRKPVERVRRFLKGPEQEEKCEE
ncbi:MAG: hypothetical protein ACLFUU_13815 [Desulfobacteraceae bacterium]